MTIQSYWPKMKSWTENIWRVIGQVTKWIPDGKIPLGRSIQQWVDRVQMDLCMLDIHNGSV